MTNIVLEISGGILQAVYSDNKEVKYTIVDHDLDNGTDLPEYEPDGYFETQEKQALINYLTNYGAAAEDFIEE